MAAEPGKVLPDQWDFGKPAVHVHAQQPGEIGGRETKSLGIQIRRLGKPANWRIHSVYFAIAALEDPFQHTAVLAESGPEELAVLVGAEPVHVIDLRELGAGPGADPEIVGEVVAHVVAAEGEHRHRVAAKFSDFAGGGRGGFAARSRPQKRSVLPTERLGHEWNNPSSAATEKNCVDRHTLGVLPLRSNHGALPCRNGEAAIGMSCFARTIRSPRAT